MAKVTIIVASTRPSRVGHLIGDWVKQETEAFKGFSEVELVDLAEHQYGTLARTEPALLAGATGEAPTGPDAVRALARGRAVVDFVASLTDSQAAALLEALSGHRGQLWTDAFPL